MVEENDVIRILGKIEFDHPPEEDYVAKWLKHPTTFSTSVNHESQPIQTSLLTLSPKLKDVLLADGKESFFPVQLSVVSYFLDLIQKGAFHGVTPFPPSDVCVISPTGTGKTFCYVLPILQCILDVKCSHLLTSLVVAPSKTLASQIYNTFQMFGPVTGLKFGLLNGSVHCSKEFSMLSTDFPSPLNVLIATPGRLQYHLERKTVDLRFLRFFVLDEADTLLRGDNNQLWSLIFNSIYTESSSSIPTFPRKRPTDITLSSCQMPAIPCVQILLSATLTMQSERLYALKLYRPILFAAQRDELMDVDISSSAPEKLKEKYVICAGDQRPLAAVCLLHSYPGKRIICFTSSREETIRLHTIVKAFPQLPSIAAIVKNSLKQSLLIKKFNDNQISVLICSDVLSRGIDLNADVVLSYDLPAEKTTYFHRIGRTARAGKRGAGVTILVGDGEKSDYFNEFCFNPQKASEIELDAEFMEELSPTYKTALKLLKKTVKADRYHQPKAKKPRR